MQGLLPLLVFMSLSVQGLVLGYVSSRSTGVWWVSVPMDGSTPAQLVASGAWGLVTVAPEASALWLLGGSSRALLCSALEGGMRLSL